MSTVAESGSPREGLYCELCEYIHFSTYSEWRFHHLNHIRQPVVRLVKLNPSLSRELLRGKSYKLNTGVARSSQHHVPPLRISVIKEQGTNKFALKTKEILRCSRLSSSEDCSSDLRRTWGDLRSVLDQERDLDVEGKDLLERLGASFSISRVGKGPPGNIVKKGGGGGGGGGGAGAGAGAGAGGGDGSVNVDLKKDILERLSGIGGISISAISKTGNVESRLGTGKTKPVEVSQLKGQLKNQVLEKERKSFDKNKVLEKLRGSGSILVSPKQVMKDEGKECKEQGVVRGEGEEVSLRVKALERLEVAGSRSNKSEDSSDSSDSKMSGESRTSQVNAGEENGKVVNENSGVEQKRFVRVKQSKFSKRSDRPERQGSQEEASDERTGWEEGRERGSLSEERGIDILERLTESLNNTVGIEKCAELSKRSDSDALGGEDPLATDAVVDGFNHDVKASEAECHEETPEPPGRPDSGGKHPQEPENAQPLLMGSSSPEAQDGKPSNYAGISQNHQPSYVESEHVSPENSEVHESTVSFSSLSNEDHSEGQGEQQTAFWSDIQSAPNSADQPQEDPLLTPENSAPNGDTNFLHNFSNDYQPGPSNLPPENSEFMSLDRLGQTQHQHSSYGSEQSNPMEHLSQQVQRIPNPTPQINVISQHHLQAPPPPQLHAGVPLSPQHISPQQANSYDPLHMQPPMPPPLYQGYMFNQNYPPQPQMQRPPQPQMPMLQQRPHISRAFPPMSAPQQRPRLRTAVKRSPIRPPQEMLSSVKQPRMSLQARSQVPSPATKLPSGITITPPKKNFEASKVANVLASRGITVTPSRQSSQGLKPQQRAQSGSSVLNIGSGVSVTTSQSRSGGGFAVPGPRRSAPIVNHNAERPERCMTVDLTQDDEIPHTQLRNKAAGRSVCNVCGKSFASPPALAAHKARHRNNVPFKCDLCTAEYSNMTYLINHRQTCHKKVVTPDLAIPIVDLNYPGAQDQLRKCGVYNFIPLAQLQSNSNGYFGVPIIQLDTAKEKAVSNLSLLGAGNILVLGKMKAISSQAP